MSDDNSPSAEALQPTGDSIGSPSEFLKVLVGKKVKVRLTSGVDYLGKLFHAFYCTTRNSAAMGMSGLLSCLDGYMNIALEQTEECVNGRVTNRYGDAFVRGNNGTLLGLFDYLRQS